MSHSIYCQRTNGFLLTKDGDPAAQLDADGNLYATGSVAINRQLVSVTLSGNFTSQTASILVEQYSLGSSGLLVKIYLPEIATSALTADGGISVSQVVPTDWCSSEITVDTAMGVDGSTYVPCYVALSTTGTLSIYRADSTVNFTSGNIVTIFGKVLNFITSNPTSV